MNLNIDNNKLQIYIYTLIIDICLIIILITQKLNIVDTLFINTILICHLVFYYSLHKEIKKIINILHYILFISLSIGIFLNNKLLILLCIALLILIQVLWIINKNCILNNISHIEHGYGDSVTIFTILITLIYITKLIT